MSFKALKNLFFPPICNGCKHNLSDNEYFLCTQCRHKLPVTNFHLNNDDYVKKVFYGRAKIVAATALLRFEKKGLVQHLLHQLKYGNNESISTFFGEWLGEELSNCKDYQVIDCVIPVPLHFKKKKLRGYNQVSQFGQKIAEALKIKSHEGNLIKTYDNTKSQARKSRQERWTEINGSFNLKNPESLKNRHILLVDDIITTGNTLEACILALHKAENIKISIATIAIA